MAKQHLLKRSALTRDVDEIAAKAEGATAMLNIKVVSGSLGIFTAISYVLSVLYGLIVPANFLARRWGGPGLCT